MMTEHQKRQEEERRAIVQKLRASRYPNRQAIADELGLGKRGYHRVRKIELRLREEEPEAVIRGKKPGRPKKKKPAATGLNLDEVRRFRNEHTRKRLLEEGLTMEEACDLQRGDMVIWKDPDDDRERRIEIHSVTGIANGLVDVAYHGGYMEADPHELRLDPLHLPRFIHDSTYYQEIFKSLEPAVKELQATVDHAAKYLAGIAAQWGGQPQTLRRMFISHEIAHWGLGHKD